MALIDIVGKALGKERTVQLVENGMYKFCVDGIANNVFSLIYILNERYVAEMNWDEAWAARGSAAIGNMITGRPYGIWRDFVMSKLGINEESHWIKKYGADVAAFATGQSWIYALYLAAPQMAPKIYEGVRTLDLDTITSSYELVDWRKLRTAVTFLTLAAPALGRPQGVVYDKVRQQFGLENEKKETN